MLILSLLKSHFKRVLTSALNTQIVGLSKIEFKELLSLATKESILFLMENPTSKSISHYEFTFRSDIG